MLSPRAMVRGIPARAKFAAENTIFSDPSIKVLGIVLDNKLQFDEHVSQMCLKASRQINALKRISKYLDEKCRILVYKSFISSNFNYCPVSWMFCGKSNLNKLGKLQERALRFVFHDATSPVQLTHCDHNASLWKVPTALWERWTEAKWWYAMQRLWVYQNKYIAERETRASVSIIHCIIIWHPWGCWCHGRHI